MKEKRSNLLILGEDQSDAVQIEKQPSCIFFIQTENCIVESIVNNSGFFLLIIAIMCCWHGGHHMLLVLPSSKAETIINGHLCMETPSTVKYVISKTTKYHDICGFWISKRMRMLVFHLFGSVCTDSIYPSGLEPAHRPLSLSRSHCPLLATFSSYSHCLPPSLSTKVIILFLRCMLFLFLVCPLFLLLLFFTFSRSYFLLLGADWYTCIPCLSWTCMTAV